MDSAPDAPNQNILDHISALVSLVPAHVFARAIAAVQVKREHARAAEMMKAGMHRTSETIGPATTETYWRRVENGVVTAD